MYQFNDGHRSFRRALASAALALWVALPAIDAASMPKGYDCGSGKFEANLTGWPINGKYPAGTAEFAAETKRLTVTVISVPLPDGTKLDVLIGDDRIGQMEPLKDGSAQAVITGSEKVEGDSRVRVFNKDVPLVSGNLICVKSEPAGTTVGL